MDDEQNAFNVNTGVGLLRDEMNAVIKECDRAIAEKKAALLERDTAIQQRDAAVAERDNALRERDNAIAALQFHEYTTNALWSSVVRGLKRTKHPTTGEDFITDACPITAIPAHAAKSMKNATTDPSKSLNKIKKMWEDLNGNMTEDCSRAEWDSQEFNSANLVNFDESSMPAPVCSCTGVARQCYKWGSGGWQSSCCTTTLSVYPLPLMPNRKHNRVGGRKMSGSVFSRLLTRVAASGHDLTTPIDLKNYWAKHGTNRYITIK